MNEFMNKNLSYFRLGTATSIIQLIPDGTIDGNVGYPERTWISDGERLRLFDANGLVIGTFRRQADGFVGRLGDGRAASLQPIDWPSGHPFGQHVDRRLETVRQSPGRRHLFILVHSKDSGLSQKTIASARSIQGKMVVFDNSLKRDMRYVTCPEVPVFEAPIPLNLTQRMNLMFEMAFTARCDTLCVIQGNVELGAGVDNFLPQAIDQILIESPSFGVMFTCYDAICVFNMNSVRKVGPWDPLFTDIHADTEYYDRLRRHGFHEVIQPMDITRHWEPTTAPDPRAPFVNTMLTSVYNELRQMIR